MAIALLPITAALSQVSPPTTVKPQETLVDGKIRIYKFVMYDMTIAAIPDSFKFLYMPSEPKPLRSAAAEHRFRYAINGSFFDIDSLRRPHAGYLRMYGKKHASTKAEAQLSHIVRYRANARRIEYIDYRTFTPDKSSSALEFQTGPIVVENGRVAEKYIRESINGPKQHRRTLLASLDRRKIFLITVRGRVALDELGRYLLKLSIFARGRLDVVNLDGGSSVALYSSAYPALNFNDGASLPILIGVK